MEKIRGFEIAKGFENEKINALVRTLYKCFKKGLILSNSVGVIDKDYYGNPDNDGHIMFAFYNIKDEDITIKKGEAIGQAVFQKYLVTDDDNASGERVGGFGSTSK